MWYIIKLDIVLGDVDYFEITDVEPDSCVASFESGGDNPLFEAASVIAERGLSKRDIDVIYSSDIQ